MTPTTSAERLRLLDAMDELGVTVRLVQADAYVVNPNNAIKRRAR